MFIQQFAAAAAAAVGKHSVEDVVALWREPAAYDSPLTGPQQGLAALAARESALFAGFSDLTATITPRGQLGSVGAALVRFDGTHDGHYAGLAPTGNTIALEMIAVVTFDDDGYVIGERVFLDTATVSAQLTERGSAPTE
ncbi:ester cyclase [Nocardia abscessus]|uniref:ester cyclase n=1 Tax=Nocardia abscessus TaxID=120957 RepID=UPI0002EAF6FB|nr:ester cyclase [Nocardia abscessus]MCC3332061.1 ester cyclase [Nocardia abscessus]